MVSEDVLDGDIYTATYSISNNTVFPKRDTTLEKRLDIQGGHCQTYCVPDDGDKPDSDICKVLYTELKSTPGIFTVYPGASPSPPQDYDTKLTDARDRPS